ncbi:MAG: glycosyltransferase family 4 protein [Anaerolineales bacterium]
MRIHLLIYGHLDTISGGYLYDRKLVEHLNQNGDHVEVITLPMGNYFRSLGDNLSVSLHKRLTHLKTDILLQDELSHASLFWINQRIKNAIEYPIVSIVHHLRCHETHPQLFNWFYALFERRYLHSVDGYIFNSLTTQKNVENLVGTGLYSVVAHPAGDHIHSNVDEHTICSRAKQSGPLNLLFLGNVIHRKGLHVLLDALQRLPAGSWHLDVAGRLDIEKMYSRRIQKLLNKSSQGQQVSLHGLLQYEALIEVLVKSHLIVVPSFIEGFGIAYLEGMGFGLPAIASTIGGAREIITHGKNGLLVPPGDSQALSDYLYQLITDRQRLIKMSLAARQRYLDHPTWEQTTDRVRSFLHSLMESYDNS